MFVFFKYFFVDETQSIEQNSWGFIFFLTLVKIKIVFVFDNGMI